MLIGKILKSLAAESWKVPVSLGISRVTAEADLRL